MGYALKVISLSKNVEPTRVGSINNNSLTFHFPKKKSHFRKKNLIVVNLKEGRHYRLYLRSLDQL